MAANYTFSIITVLDGEELKGYIWEILSQGARIYSRKLIGTKNDCWISMTRVSRSHYEREPNRMKVKTRTVQLNDVRYP
jgi:hypothetical protein